MVLGTEVWLAAEAIGDIVLGGATAGSVKSQRNVQSGNFLPQHVAFRRVEVAVLQRHRKENNTNVPFLLDCTSRLGRCQFWVMQGHDRGGFEAFWVSAAIIR